MQRLLTWRPSPRIVWRATSALLVLVTAAAMWSIAAPPPATAGKAPGQSPAASRMATSPPTATLTTAELAAAATIYQCAESGDPANAPDAFEPGDNTSGGATELAVGTSQVHNLCSATTGPDVDWFTFEAVTSLRYTVATTNLSAVVDTFMIVEGPDGFIAEDDDSGTGVGSQISFTPATSGRFFVQITQASKTPFTLGEAAEPRAYTILLSTSAAPTVTSTATPRPATATPTATPSPCRDPYEGDNGPGGAEGLYVSQDQGRILCGDGDVDWAWVDLVAHKPYRIVTADLADGVDTLMVLYDGDAETMLQINDDYPGMNLASRIDITSPTTKRYYLKVQDAAGHGAPDFRYTLRLESDGLPQGGPCLDTYEADGLPAQATEILLRQSQRHGFCPEGDADWVRFYGQAGKAYTLLTRDLTVGTDTTITVFGTDQATLIGFDDDGGGSLASRVGFVAPASGIYYAQVKNVGDIGGKGQEYSLELTSEGAAAVPPPQPRPPGATTAPTLPPTAATPTPVRTTAPTFVSTMTSVPTTATTETATAETVADTVTAQATPALVSADFVDAAFAGLWTRTDGPVRAARAERSWFWGAQPGPAYQETYKGAPGGQRLVQYFDKGRMEITQPGGDRQAPGFVTSGLLVREMIAGLVQYGDATSDRLPPAPIALVGDGSDDQAPTYASLTAIASLDNDRRVPSRVGAPVLETLSRDGKIGERGAGEHHVASAVYIEASGHNIPDVFWDFLTRRGLVETEQGYAVAELADWMTAFGLPISEAYWTRAVVGGVERDVLVQVFERRVLTYTPDNPAGWQVEMGNVGQHYHRWRYGA